MLWDRVGELADRAPRLSDLRHHKLHLLAASRMRTRGEAVPAELLAEERRLAAVSISAAPLLRRVRDASDARIIVMKGPEAAARWPQTPTRSSRHCWPPASSRSASPSSTRTSITCDRCWRRSCR